MDRGAGGLQSTGSQRAGHDWVKTFPYSSFSAGQPGRLFHNKSVPCHLLAWNPEMASQQSHRIRPKSLRRPTRSPMTRLSPSLTNTLLASAPALPSVQNLSQMLWFCSESFCQRDQPWLHHLTHSKLTLTFLFNHMPLPHLLTKLCCLIFSFFHTFHSPSVLPRWR